MRKVLISGAGIAGPSLAYWLLKYGFEPTLIERAPSFRDGGYMIDVWGTGYEILERYGLLEAAKSHGYHFDRLKFVDGNGRKVSGFGGDVFSGALDDRLFSIPRGDLAHVLFQTIDGKVETIFGTTIQALAEDDEGVQVELADGSTRRFDLVVGAGGLHSRVRELVFGPEQAFEKYLGYCAGSFVAADYPHRDDATYTSFAQPGRQISRYAMRDNKTAFLLVFAANAPPQFASHDIAAHKRLLREEFGGDGWESREILRRLDAADELYFDIVSQIRMPQWTRGRIALVGDAAYCPSLLAGAGSAFAMLGAYVLAGELHWAVGDHRPAFAAYEKRLSDFLRRQQDNAVRFAGSFTPKTRFGVLLRDCILNVMNIRPIGVWLTRQMLGETYPLPDYG
ncbi:MAG TPA: FAD-binding domain [Rhizomicrobium sp.]|jgi:2-polyprenyl-6-methoxyphenol hydroxylase-like FAD-dependent oxidoreductase